MQIGREMLRALCRPAGWMKNCQCETVPLDLKCLYECISAYMGGQTPENMNESVYPRKPPPLTVPLAAQKKQSVTILTPLHQK